MYGTCIFFCKNPTYWRAIYLSKRESENKAWHPILPPILSMITCMWLGCLRQSHGSNWISFNMQNYLLNQNHRTECFQSHVFNSYCVIRKLFTHDICLFWVFNKNWWTTSQCAFFFGGATVRSTSVIVVSIAMVRLNYFAIEPD